MLMRALSKSLAQMGDKRIIGVFAKSLLISLILCVGLGLILARVVRWLIGSYFTIGTSSWMDAMLYVGSVGLAFLAFRAVAVPVMGFFGDEVVAAIEEQHYPAEAGLARRATAGVSLRLGLASLLRVLTVNLLAMPVYIFLIFTAIGPLLLFLALNAVLLGRDLAEMVAVRHLDSGQMRQWVRNHRLDYALLGLIITGLFLIPFVNLLAPIVGAAAATHLFHGRRI